MYFISCVHVLLEVAVVHIFISDPGIPTGQNVAPVQSLALYLHLTEMFYIPALKPAYI